MADNPTIFLRAPNHKRTNREIIPSRQKALPRLMYIPTSLEWLIEHPARIRGDDHGSATVNSICRYNLMPSPLSRHRVLTQYHTTMKQVQLCDRYCSIVLYYSSRKRESPYLCKCVAYMCWNNIMNDDCLSGAAGRMVG